MVILTPYFSTIVQRKYNECAEEPDYNYTPYNLFCLKTRLYPIVHKLFDDQVDILFDRYIDPSLSNNYDNHTRLEFSNINPSKLFVSLILVRYRPFKEKNVNELRLDEGVVEVELTPTQREIIQAHVNLITSKDVDACLLISNNLNLLDSFGYKISKDWLRSMLPYIQINEYLHPFVNEQGLHIVLTRYVTSRKKPVTYYERYYQLLQSAILQLQKMYTLGYIIIPPTLEKQTIIDNWDLEPVDNEGLLYRPRWFDLRFTQSMGGMVPFLQSRLRNEKYVDIEVSDNLVRKHYIATILTENKISFKFINKLGNSIIRCKISNLTNARIVSSLINTAQSQAYGSVLISNYPSNPPSNLISNPPSNLSSNSLANLTLNQLSNLQFKGEFNNQTNKCIEYQTNDPLRPYTISCLT